jgi:hypothetical protein
MPKLLENFTIEIGDTIEKEIGPVVPNTSHVWDTSIPVANVSGLIFEGLVFNNKMYEYTTPVKILYTDPNLSSPDNEGNVANNTAIIVESIIGHHKGANTIQLVLNMFPQYFTE